MCLQFANHKKAILVHESVRTSSYHPKYSLPTESGYKPSRFSSFSDSARNPSRFPSSVRVRSYQYLVQRKNSSSCFLAFLDSSENLSRISLLRNVPRDQLGTFSKCPHQKKVPGDIFLGTFLFGDIFVTNKSAIVKKQKEGAEITPP